MAEVITVNVPQGDFVTTTLNGAISNSATSFTIGTGLNLDANGGFLQINYDSIIAVGTDGGPETVAYTGYVTGTGAVTGVTRAQGGGTAVAHSNGATVTCGTSAKYLMNGNVLGFSSATTNQGTFAAETDITGLSVTVTVPAGGRRVKITAVTNPGNSSAGDSVQIRIKEGATTLLAGFLPLPIADFSTTNNLIYVGTPTAGSHTYKVSIARQSGAGNITSYATTTSSAYILVELI